MNRYFTSEGLAVEYRQVQLQKKNMAFQHVDLKHNKHGWYWVPQRFKKKGKRRHDQSW